MLKWESGEETETLPRGKIQNQILTFDLSKTCPLWREAIQGCFPQKTFVDPGCDPVKAVESKSGSDFLRKQLRCKVPSRSSVPALGHALVLGPGSSL